MASTSDKRSARKVQNIRLPLIGSMTNRDSTGTKDQRFLNIFPETRKVDQIESTKVFMNKRPGLTAYKDFGTGEGRGCAYFNNKIYVAIGNTVYEDGVTPTAKITLNGSTGPVGFTLGNSRTSGDYLFVCDGASAWTINTAGTVTAIRNDTIQSIIITAGGTGFTNGTYAASFSGGGGAGAAANYTCSGGAVISVVITNKGSGYTSAPTISFPSGGGSAAAGSVYLNSLPSPHVPTPTFIDGYILLPKGIDIWSSYLDDATLWSSNDYISAEMFPDQIRALSRQNNQVVAFGEMSTEFFYDAANPTGSPLSRNESTTLQYGVAAPYAIYQNEKTIIFISQSDSGGRSVFQVDGFTPKRVSDEFVDRILDAEVDMTDCRGFGLRTKGHLFYVINLPTSNRTLVYDVDEKLWHEWSTNVNGTHNVFAYNNGVDTHEGLMYLLHNSDGTLVKLDPTVYQDLTTAILVEVTTNRYDMDTLNRKFQSNFRIVGDRYETGNSITMQFTDNDYQSWSAVKTIALTDDFPNFARMGSFRRRAYKIKHSANYNFRCESIEVTFVEGSH